MPAEPSRSPLPVTVDPTRVPASNSAQPDVELRLALALDAGAHAPFDVDLRTGEFRPTARLCGMFGVTDPSEVPDREAWRALILDEDRPRVLAAVEQATADRGGYQVEYRVRRPSDGSVRWMRTRARVVLDEGGQPARLLGVTTDITDLRSAADVLHATAEERHIALEIAQLGTWELDVASGLTRVDDRAAEILGLDPSRAHPAEAVLDVMHADDRERVWAAVSAALQPDGGLYDIEYRVVGKDGVRTVAARGRTVAPSLDRRGGARRFVGTVMDVTERTRHESALRHQAELLTAIIDNIPVLLVIWDPLLATFRFNRHLRDVLGWTEADATDGRFMERVYPDPAYRDDVSAYMRSLAPGWRDLKTTAKDGSVIDISWANVELSGGASIGIGVDVRERKAVEDAMARVNQQLEEADRRKDEFIALLAHELRNPLAPVRTAVGILRALGPTEPVLVRCRDIIDRQVTQMARLLDDLLDVSRMARGKLALQRTPVLLKDVIEAALELGRPVVEQFGHEVVVEGLDSPLLLEADAARLTQVFGNLINNAAKYSARGGLIRITATRGDDCVRVAVRDRGIGIEPGMLEHIFDLFTQADGPEVRAGGGLGIGLSLARSLVEMHGGTISASSAGPGTGSEFVVTLPLSPISSRPAEPAFVERTRAPRRRRVLVADDNADSAEMMATLLEQAGCDVRTVNDGEAAVREADAFRPDLVLLDIGMPGLTGYEACEQIRRCPWAADTMVVAVTGWGQERDVRRSSEAGFDRHLVKPVDPLALVRLVDEERPSRAT